MKREILDLKRKSAICGCCPGHDVFPDEVYENNRSQRARSRDKKIEHRLVRRVKRMQITGELTAPVHGSH